MKRIIFAFLILSVLMLSMTPCFAFKETTLTDQSDVKGISGWLNSKEFIYLTKTGYYTYNIESRKFSATEFDNEWTGNSALWVRLEKDYMILKQKDAKNRLLLPFSEEDINVEIISVSLLGRYIILPLQTDYIDHFKIMIYDVTTREFIKIPLEGDEYSFGTNEFSLDERFVAIDLAKVKQTRGEVEIYNSGILVYDLINKKVYKKYLLSSEDFFVVKSISDNQVIFIDDKDYLNTYHMTKNTSQIISKSNIFRYALFGHFGDAYVAKNGKLVSVNFVQ